MTIPCDIPISVVFVLHFVSGAGLRIGQARALPLSRTAALGVA